MFGFLSVAPRQHSANIIRSRRSDSRKMVGPANQGITHLIGVLGSLIHPGNCRLMSADMVQDRFDYVGKNA